MTKTLTFHDILDIWHFFAFPPTCFYFFHISIQQLHFCDISWYALQEGRLQGTCSISYRDSIFTYFAFCLWGHFTHQEVLPNWRFFRSMIFLKIGIFSLFFNLVQPCLDFNVMIDLQMLCQPCCIFWKVENFIATFALHLRSLFRMEKILPYIWRSLRHRQSFTKFSSKHIHSIIQFFIYHSCAQDEENRVWAS